MSSSNQYDVIIIGSGAGGGTLLYRLAASGKKILLLERGDYVRREPENWSTRSVNLESRYKTKEVWRDARGEALHPHTNYFVGGNTKFYGAALFRFRRQDFCAIRVHGNRGEDPTEAEASSTGTAAPTRSRTSTW
jgi:choline dehydrogenase-like flavoprotein